MPLSFLQCEVDLVNQLFFSSYLCYRFPLRVCFSPNLQWFNLTIFQLYDGAKAIHIINYMRNIQLINLNGLSVR